MSACTLYWLEEQIERREGFRSSHKILEAPFKRPAASTAGAAPKKAKATDSRQEGGSLLTGRLQEANEHDNVSASLCRYAHGLLAILWQGPAVGKMCKDAPAPAPDCTRLVL